MSYVMDGSLQARLQKSARALSGMAAALSEQSGFWSGKQLPFAISAVTEGAGLAAKRAVSSGTAGRHLGHELEKTVLSESIRALLLAQSVLSQTPPPERWPDIEQSIPLVRACILEAAARDPALFHPPNFPANPDLCAPSPVQTNHAWKTAEKGRWYIHLPQSGIVLSAVSLQTKARDTAWIAKVGGVGVSIHPKAVEACLAAESALALVAGCHPFIHPVSPNPA